LLGSASLIAFSGAQAADLPVKAKAVEYVRICSLYGDGFYYIPGTDTCIKLGGYLRVSVEANSNYIGTGNTYGQTGTGNRFANAYTWQSRLDLSIDTRTATEYGVVRTYFDATFSWSNDSYTANGTNALGSVYSQIGAGVGQTNNGTSGAVAAGTLGVYYAFIQFAGFTMGKNLSPFSAPWANYPGNSFDGLVGGGGSITGVNQFDYTAQFGNGVSATIAVVDPTLYYQAAVLNFGAFGSGASFTGAGDYAGTVAPDIVGNLSVSQAWGFAQLSVAAHDNNVAYYNNGNIPAGHANDVWGYAVQAALTIKNVPTGAGDTINADVVYTNGATRYNIQDLAGAAGAWTTTNGNNALPGQLGSVGVGFAPDSVFNTNGQQQLISTWGGRAGYNHNWNPQWNSSVYGAYAAVSYGSATSAGSAASIVCASLAVSLPSITTCNPNFSVTQAGFITRWNPVKNLVFLADFTWEHLSQNYAGAVTTSGGYGVGSYAIANQNTYQVLLRALRSW